MSTRWLPTAPQITRQAVLMLGAALLVGVVLAHVPTVRAWLDKQMLP